MAEYTGSPRQNCTKETNIIPYFDASKVLKAVRFKIVDPKTMSRIDSIVLRINSICAAFDLIVRKTDSIVIKINLIVIRIDSIFHKTDSVKKTDSIVIKINLMVRKTDLVKKPARFVPLPSRLDAKSIDLIVV